MEENTELAEKSNEAGSGDDIASNTKSGGGSEIKAEGEDRSGFDIRDRNTSSYAESEAEVEEI